MVPNETIVVISARRNFSGREGEARSTKGGLVRGSPRGGFRGAEPPDAGEVFKKFTIFKKFEGNFAIFSKFFKVFSNFWGKFGGKMRKI